MEKINKLKGKTVVLKENENINVALRRLKKIVDESGLLDDLRSKESYIKPTTQRKTSRAAARARWRKQLRDNQLPPKLY